jgi:hypothetical protein
MLTFSLRQRHTTAITFLVIFLNVLVGQVACAMRGPQAAPVAHQHGHGDHHQHASGSAPHHHDASHEHGTAAGTTHADKHEHKSATSCCQDDAAAIWAALHSPPKVTFDKPDASLLDLPPAGLAWPIARFCGSWAVLAPVRLVPPRHLPPKIPDLRVFLRSLTV